MYDQSEPITRRYVSVEELRLLDAYCAMPLFAGGTIDHLLAPQLPNVTSRRLAITLVLMRSDTPREVGDLIRQEYWRIEGLDYVPIVKEKAEQTAKAKWEAEHRPARPLDEREPERRLSAVELLAVLTTPRLGAAERQGILDAHLNADGENPPTDKADARRRQRGRAALRDLTPEELIDIVLELRRRDAQLAHIDSLLTNAGRVLADIRSAGLKLPEGQGLEGLDDDDLLVADQARFVGGIEGNQTFGSADHAPDPLADLLARVAPAREV